MNRKKISLVLVFFLAFFLVGCTQKASDPKVDNWDKYQEQGSITIGFDNTFVPMGFEEKNGQYAGFDIDLAQAVSENFKTAPLMLSGMDIQRLMNAVRRLLLLFLTWKISRFSSQKNRKISSRFRI